MPSHSLSLIPCFSFTLPVRFSSPHLISSHRKTFFILPSHPLDPFIWFSVKCLIVFLLWKWKFFLQFTQTDNRLNSQNWPFPLRHFLRTVMKTATIVLDDIDLTFGTLAWRDNILFPQLRRWFDWLPPLARLERCYSCHFPRLLPFQVESWFVSINCLDLESLSHSLPPVKIGIVNCSTGVSFSLQWVSPRGTEQRRQSDI